MSLMLTTVEEVYITFNKASIDLSETITYGADPIVTSLVSRRSRQKTQITSTTWCVPFVQMTESLLILRFCPLWKKSTSARDH